MERTGKRFVVYSADGFTEDKNNNTTDNAQIVMFIEPSEGVNTLKQAEKHLRAARAPKDSRLRGFDAFIISEIRDSPLYVTLRAYKRERNDSGM